MFCQSSNVDVLLSVYASLKVIIQAVFEFNPIPHNPKF